MTPPASTLTENLAALWHELKNDLPQQIWSDWPQHPILAISGGRDSMFLLHLVAAYRMQQESLSQVSPSSFTTGPNLIGANNVCQPVAFYFDHGLRPDTEMDLELIRKYCSYFNIPFYSEQRSVPEAAKRLGMSLEETGRTLRYRAMMRLGLSLQESKSSAVLPIIITAHHSEDYLESLLIHLIRGGGPTALQTMQLWHHSTWGPLIFRPLLHLNRARIADLVEKYQIEFHEDSSNASRDMLRNRLRQDVLPSLLKEGLQSNRLWQNFHDPAYQQPATQSAGLNLSGQNIADKRSQQGMRPDWVQLDRRLFQCISSDQLARNLKACLDVAFRQLGLPPLERNTLKELQKQINGRLDYKLRFEHPHFKIWCNRRGAVYIFHHKAACLRPPRLLKIPLDQPGFNTSDALLEIQYNNRQTSIKLQPHQGLTRFQPGQMVSLSNGQSRKLKKVLSEAGLPLYVRSVIPLIEDRPTGKIVRVCLSLFNGLPDLFFASPQSSPTRKA